MHIWGRLLGDWFHPMPPAVGTGYKSKTPNAVPVPLVRVKRKVRGLKAVNLAGLTQADRPQELPVADA